MSKLFKILVKSHVLALSLTMVIMWLFYGCNGRPCGKYDVVKDIIGTRMNISLDSMECLIGKECAIVNMPDADFIILSYVDSTSCIPCQLKLDKWFAVMEHFQAGTSADVRLLVVIGDRDMSAISQDLIPRDFAYPIVLDTCGIFLHGNEYTVGKGLSSFLLNRHRQILAVGNPVQNPAVRQLYQRIIHGEDMDSMLVVKDSSVDCNITSSRNHIMLGGIRNGECKSVQVVLHNAGDEVAVVDDIVTSCDCTEASLDVDSLAPGTRRFLTVSVRNDSVAGRFERTVDVFFKNSRQPVRLTVAAYGI